MRDPWYHAVPLLLDQVELIRPTSILEIGLGIGKYGRMFRETLEPDWPHSRRHSVTIEGVEIGRT